MYFGEIALPRGIRRRIVTKILIRLWRHDAWIRVIFLPCYSWTKLQFSSPRQWSTSIVWTGFKVIKCLNAEQECFIGFKTTSRNRVVLDPIKHSCFEFFVMGHCRSARRMGKSIFFVWKTTILKCKINQIRESFPRIELFGGGKWQNGSFSNITQKFVRKFGTNLQLEKRRLNSPFHG